MNYLALDTSTDRAELGVLTSAGLVQVASTDGTRRHGRDLIPALHTLLGEAGLSVRDLGVVGVGLGPGSYTGLRIGLTAARTLAYATGAGLLGFDSLAVWARSAPDAVLRVHVVGDAQRGDVYAADFARETPGGPLACVLPSRIEPLETWARRLHPPALVLGPGLASTRILQAVPGAVDRVGPSGPPPRAGAMLGLVRELWESGHRDDPWTLEPNYLRRSAAEDQWEVRRSAAP
jgi:tRNA threonylcarbamoyladenosine biosynthesis protein TsaB